MDESIKKINLILIRKGLKPLKVEQQYHKQYQFKSDNHFQNLSEMISEVNQLISDLNNEKTGELYIENFSVTYNHTTKIGTLNFNITDMPF